MLYITGIQALNIPCKLDTCGDWHSDLVKEEKIKYRLSEESIFKSWGIEKKREIFTDGKKYNVANTIRAILDLLETGNIGLAQGMREDYICNEKYNEILFEKVDELRNNEHWEEIDKLMQNEYYMKWVDYKCKRGNIKV